MRCVFALAVLASGCADFGALSADYSPYCADDALFCDGFEQGLGAWAWDPDPDPSATVALSQLTSHFGERSVDALAELRTPARNVITHTLADTVPTLWARVYVSASVFDGDAQLIGLDNGITVWLSGAKWGLRDAQQIDNSTTAPGPGWTCLELSMTNANADLFAAGTKVASLTGAYVPVGAVWLGIVEVDGTEDQQVQFDDLSISRARPGCPAQN